MYVNKKFGQLNVVNHDFGCLDEIGHFSTQKSLERLLQYDWNNNQQ